MKDGHLDIETRIIQAYVDPAPGLAGDDFNHGNLNWNTILERASLNRVLYAFSKNLLDIPKIQQDTHLVETLERIIFEGNKWLTKLSKTIEFVGSTLGGSSIPFLVVKTHRTLPYVTIDLDILVQRGDVDKAIEVMKATGATSRECASKAQYDILMPGLLRIDLHTGFFWQQSTFLDDDLVWENHATQMLAGVECNVPSLEVEVLLAMAHILFERFHITLLDFLFIQAASTTVDWSVLTAQAEKFGWRRSLYNLALTCQEICRKLGMTNNWDNILPVLAPADSRLSLLRRAHIQTLHMPYMYSIPLGLDIFVERTQARLARSAKSLAYFLFTKFRYHLTGHRRVPMYGHWFDFASLPPLGAGGTKE